MINPRLSCADVPRKIVQGQQWFNPDDEKIYIANIRSKVWKSIDSFILMPRGTIYREEISGNEYVLGKNNWKIIKVGDIRELAGDTPGRIQRCYSSDSCERNL